MAKKDKRGTPATGLTAEERASQNVANNKKRYHLSTGDASTELSENSGQSPEQRFKSRGVTDVPKTTRRRTTRGY